MSIPAENAADATDAATIDHHTPSMPMDDIGINRTDGTISWDISPMDRAWAGRSVAARVWFAFTATQENRYVSENTVSPDAAIPATSGLLSPRNRVVSGPSAEMQMNVTATPIAIDARDMTENSDLTLRSTEGLCSQ